jgi:hypothetical protein
MDEFQIREVKARIIQKWVVDKAFCNKKYDYYATPIEGYDCYDGGVVVYDKDTGSIIKRYIIETKVRDEHYDELVYEWKKHKDLVEKGKLLDSSILYLNVTPRGTYLFKISDVIGDVIWDDDKEYNKTTAVKSNKIKKKATNLPIIKAKTFEWTTADVEKEYYIKNILKRTENVIRKDEKKKGFLVEWLTEAEIEKSDF